jgi:hypothetical protein
MASKKRRSLVAVPTSSESKKNVTEDDSSLIAWLDQGADINAKNSE